MIFTSGDHRLVVKVVATVEIVAVLTMLLFTVSLSIFSTLSENYNFKF